MKCRLAAEGVTPNDGTCSVLANRISKYAESILDIHAVYYERAEFLYEVSKNIEKRTICLDDLDRVHDIVFSSYF